jgi:sec-independent protein translocase protein TatA
MGGFSMMHWVIVALVILILFGRGKISETMGDFGKGIKSFRKGMGEEMDKPAAPTSTAQIAPQSGEAQATPTSAETTKP